MVAIGLRQPTRWPTARGDAERSSELTRSGLRPAALGMAAPALGDPGARSAAFRGDAGAAVIGATHRTDENGGDVDDDKDVLTALFFLFVFEVDDDDDDDESRELLLGFFITMCAALFLSVVQVACAARVAAASMTRSHSVSLSLSF